VGILSSVIPANVQAAINWAIDKIDSLLKGETALVIGNGAAIVLYFVAKAFGKIPDMSFEDALAAGGVAIVTINSVLLTIRKYVYSPATVAAIVASPPTAAGPIAAAVDAGVTPEAIEDAADDVDPDADVDEDYSES
jgi:hypothetical protein